MRELAAAVMALVVLLTLARVSSLGFETLAMQVREERNLANIAAYVMLHANCSDAYDYLRRVNATQPVKNQPAKSVYVWCGNRLVEIPFTWRG